MKTARGITLKQLASANYNSHQMHMHIISCQYTNKSAAGMQHTPPWEIFKAKKIILKLDLFMQSLKKIGKEMPKIESEKPIYNVNQGP